MLVGDDPERVQNWQVSLLQHVVGNPLRVVGDPIVCCYKNAIAWRLNEALIKQHILGVCYLEWGEVYNCVVLPLDIHNDLWFSIKGLGREKEVNISHIRDGH